MAHGVVVVVVVVGLVVVCRLLSATPVIYTVTSVRSSKSNQIKSTVDLVRLLQLERRRITLSS